MFEDTDEVAPIWDFEDRLAGDAAAREAAGPALEPRGVMDASMADVLSAYSSEQGVFSYPKMLIGARPEGAGGCVFFWIIARLICTITRLY